MRFEQYFPDCLGLPRDLSWTEEERKYTEKLRTAVVESIILTVKSLRNLADGLSYRAGSVKGLKPDFKIILETEIENIIRLKEIEGQAIVKLLLMDQERMERDEVIQKDEQFWLLAVSLLGLMRGWRVDLTELAATQVQEYLRTAEAAAREVCYLVDPIHYSRPTQKIWSSLNHKVSEADLLRSIKITEARMEEMARKGIL